LTHGDSMSNAETIKRGGVQFTSAGTGIFHSEYNNHSSLPVHFLQIWVKPKQKGIKPAYCTMNFSDEQKKNRLCKIVSQDGNKDSIKINQNVDVYASILDQGAEVKHQFKDGRRGYVHIVSTGGSATLNGEQKLNSGDGAFVTDANELSISGSSSTPCELLLFDLE